MKQAANRAQDLMSEDEIMEFKEAFSMFDRDGDGAISHQELGQVMSGLGVDCTDEELRDLIEEVDIEGSGAIDFPAFLRMMHMMKPSEAEIEQRRVFAVFDPEETGFITKSQLCQVLEGLGERLGNEEINEMIKEADVDQDGKVNYEEFLRMLAMK